MQRGYKSYTDFIKDSEFPKALLNMNIVRRKQTQESSQLFSYEYPQLHACNENGEQHLSNCIRATSRIALASAHTGVSTAIWIILEHLCYQRAQTRGISALLTQLSHLLGVRTALTSIPQANTSQYRKDNLRTSKQRLCGPFLSVKFDGLE